MIPWFVHDGWWRITINHNVSDGLSQHVSYAVDNANEFMMWWFLADDGRCCSRLQVMFKS